MTDDEPTHKDILADPAPKAEVFVLRVWRDGGDAAGLRLRIVPAANEAAPRYFSSWQALAEWGARGDDTPNPD